MKVRRLRILARRRWRPSLAELVRMTVRKHTDHLLDSLQTNNALYRHLRGMR